MSAIIGICSSKFCLFVADRRLVSINGNVITVANDDVDKIFQLNANVIFGVTGAFVDGEEFLAPFNAYSSFEDITLGKALNSIINYTITNFKMIESCEARNYIFGGKQDGTYYMSVAHFNDEKGVFELDTVSPNNDGVEYRILLSPIAKPYEAQFKEQISKAFENAQTIKELIIEIVKVIGKIADIDKTVGRNINYFIV